MTDTFEVAGDFSPAQMTHDFATQTSAESHSAVMAHADTAAAAGNATATATETDTAGAIGTDAPALADQTPAEPTTPAAPNGFVLLGLAAELVRAVADLGYEQPTVVQSKTIPLALPSADSASASGTAVGSKTGNKSDYIDLMVSSQTGSGKTAAFLLPVLHTLLAQQVAAEAAERVAFERPLRMPSQQALLLPSAPSARTRPARAISRRPLRAPLFSARRANWRSRWRTTPSTSCVIAVVCA